MIVQIRGTSGSGKTYIARKILDKDLGWEAVTEPFGGKNRRVPLYYLSSDGKIAICGSYEAICGGCDGVGSARSVYNLYDLLKSKGIKHIVSEGLLLSEDTKWTLETKEKGWNPKVFSLTTPEDICVKQVLARREEANNTKPFNKSNTVKRIKVIDRAIGKLRKAGVQCFDVNSRNCTALILRTLGVQ